MPSAPLDPRRPHRARPDGGPADPLGDPRPGRHRQRLRGCRARGHPLAGRRRRARARSSGRRTSPGATAWSAPTGRTPSSSPTPTWMPSTSPARTASTTSTPCSRCAPGKPVLVEKAFTRNLREADEVLETAAAAGLLAAEAMWSRYLPHYDVIRRTVEAGTLGEVVARRRRPRPAALARRPGPALAARAGRRGAARPRRLPGLVRRPRARRARRRHRPRHPDRPRCRRHHARSRPAGPAAASPTCGARWRGPPPARPGSWAPGRGSRWQGPLLQRRERGAADRARRERARRVRAEVATHGFRFEAAEVARALAAGRLETWSMPWAATRRVHGRHGRGAPPGGRGLPGRGRLR